MNKTEVIIYQKANGDCPFMDFYNDLNVKMKAKVAKMIDVLEIYGSELREPYSKHLLDGLFELRIKFGNDNSRIIYFFYDGNKAILTNGFIKKDRKIPQREIKKAITFRKDYIERSKKHD